jgi:DNA-binding beta-propeller fold protein YncE
MSGTNTNYAIRVLGTALLCGVVGFGGQVLAQTSSSAAGFAYIGTLDKKLLIFDENKEEVVGEIQLKGVPRSTVLTGDQKTLVIMTTMMDIETVDLVGKKMTAHFSLSDEKSKPRIPRSGGNGVALDPTGRYMYATMRASVRETDYYRMEDAQFVVIDLQAQKIVKSFSFPPDMDQGFGFGATYKVSPNGKLLYVFQEDILIFDLATFKQVDSIEMAQPEYPGASPYRLNPADDPNNNGNVITSMVNVVDPIVHKTTFGVATLDLTTRKSTFTPYGRELPTLGFLVSPDHTKAYSIMSSGVGENRGTEFWYWDLVNHKIVRKEPFETRPTFKFGMSGDGKKLYLYGAGSTLEVFDAETLKSRKLIFLNKDTTTNLVTLAAAGTVRGGR